MKNNILIWAGLIALAVLSSCDDYLTQVSENDTSTVNHFKTEQDVEAAVYGMHEQYRSVMGDYLQNYRDRGMLLDNYGLATWKQFASHDLAKYPATSPEFSWIFEYKAVSCCNLVIDNAHRADMSEERLHFYMGQALMMRASVYFQIIRLWGDAPLIVDYENIEERGRTPWVEVAERIIADLKQAVEYLPYEHELRNSKGGRITNKQIPCKGSANALLAHVCAWVAGYGQLPEYYAEGIKAATAVISDGNYQLADNPEDVCVKVLKGGTPENVFDITYDFGRGEYKDAGAYLAGAVQRYPIQENTTPATNRRYSIKNTTVASLYAPEDRRLAAYFYNFEEMAGQPTSITRGLAYVQLWRHIKTYSGGVMEGEPQTYDMDEVVIRLADVILLRAEMYARTGDEGAAVKDLDAIRKRAGVAGYSVAEGDLKEAIQAERDKELFLQTLVRYFDRCRNHTYGDLLGGYKTLTEQEVKDGALFMPISTDAISNNPAMKQTVYWNKQFGY